jgi:hypothetical protein
MGYQELFATWVPGTGDEDVEYYVNHRGGRSDAIDADQTQAPPDDFPDDPLPWKKLGGSENERYVFDGVTSVETDPWRYDYETPPDIRTTCIDAVLLHHVLPLCDIDTDSRNDDGVIDDEDDPVENADAGPGRIVPVGSSQLTEVHLSAAPVDAVLAVPQDWRACLWSPDGGGNVRIWDTPDKQHELHFPTTGADWWNDELTPTDTCWAITTANPLDMTVWIEGISTGTTELQLAVASFDPGAQPNAQPRKYAIAGWWDAIKFATAAVDIDTDSNNNVTIERSEQEDSVEDDPNEPGKVILLNNDDDNHNDLADMDEVDVTGNSSVYAAPDDDLMPALLDYTLTTYGSQAGWKLELTCTDGLRMWGDQQRNIPGGITVYNVAHTLYVWNVTPGPTSDIYVEGISPGRESVTWAMLDPGGHVVASDTVVFTVVRADLDADTNRDNVIDDSDEPHEDQWTAEHGAIILDNADDDDNDHKPDNWDGSDLDLDGFNDAADTIINVADIGDIGPLVMPRLGFEQFAQLPASLADNLTVKLQLESVPGQDAYWTPIIPVLRARVFLPTLDGGSQGVFCQEGDVELLGPTAGSSVTFRKDPANPAHDISIFHGLGEIVFGIEGLYPGAPVQITATYYLGTQVLRVETVQLKVSPFIAFSHESPVASGSVSNPTLYVSEITGANPWENNSELRSTLGSIYQSSLAVVPYGDTSGDIWWQDPFEIGYVQAPYGQMHMILALPRSTIVRSDLPPSEWGDDFYDYARKTIMRNGVGLFPDFCKPLGGVARDCDDGGNFEVMPGLNSLGNTFGTIVMAKGPPAREGDDGKMDDRVVEFLVAQDVQDVIDDVDLTWMNLGHIDEVVSFPTAADGRARVASPEAAWALLRIAQEAGEGEQWILDHMNNHAGATVNSVLGASAWRTANFGPGGYSDKLLAVRDQLGLTSPITQQPTSGNGAPDGVLRRAGYLDVYDNNLFTYGEEIEWKLEFTSADDYHIYYRRPGNSNWVADGSGKRSEDSVSDSRVVYVLKAWWSDPVAKPTAAGNTVTFATRRSPDMIEMPVLFCDFANWSDDYEHHYGAVALTNNVVNSLVDGSKLVHAYVYGPDVAGAQFFNWYTSQAAGLLGFTVYACEERVYHNWKGSIHCGTNVLREIPSENWWEDVE